MLDVTCDLRGEFGQVRDQGSRPTCLAFATSDAHAGLRKPWEPLSAEFIFYHAQRRGGRAFDTGASLPDMLTALREDGQPLEGAWPYLTTLPAKLADYGPPSNVTVFRRAGDHVAGDIAEIVASLDAGQPVLVLLMLSNSFYMPDETGLVMAAPGEAPDPLRRHAVIAVGHGTRGGEPIILVRNSWGEGWGLKGHAWLPASYLTPRLTRLALLKETINVPAPNLAA
jgi:C1A family cysteine protease